MKPNYIQRRAAAVVAMLPESNAAIISANAEFETAAKITADAMICMANSARQAGLLLETRTGQMNLSGPMWTAYLEAHLPFSIERARMFGSIARRLKQPANTVEQAVKFMRHLLVGAGRMTLPERAVEQCSRDFDPLLKFCSGITRIKEPLVKHELVRPIEEWSASDLRLLLSETAWLDQKRATAKALLAKAGGKG
jgi:hypothetical protein